MSRPASLTLPRTAGAFPLPSHPAVLGQQLALVPAAAALLFAAQKTGGVVVSTTDKTAHVLVERKVKHPKYAKQYKITKKFAVHDEENAANVGDVVTFAPCAPKSKRKRHSLTGFIEQKNQNQKVRECVHACVRACVCARGRAPRPARFPHWPRAHLTDGPSARFGRC